MRAFRHMCKTILIALATSNLAQADQPSRNGNVWDGVAHQPSQSIIQEREKAAGFQASPGREKRDDEAVDALARKLLKER
jgi:hypothetical protein